MSVKCTFLKYHQFYFPEVRSNHLDRLLIVRFYGVYRNSHSIGNFLIAYILFDFQFTHLSPLRKVGRTI